jgi:hypothetical protein
MNKITRYGNWCEHDQLDGVDLVNGEFLIVEWPDGTRAGVRIFVDTTPGAYSDHGHEYPLSRKIAYARSKVRGVPVNVPLLGLKAMRK